MMPNIKSSEKDVKKSAENRLYNKAIKSEVKTTLKRAISAIEAQSADAAEHVKIAGSKLDKAAAKGIIHKNKAARQKSRLAKKMASASE